MTNVETNDNEKRRDFIMASSYLNFLNYLFPKDYFDVIDFCFRNVLTWRRKV